ncbi:hypothetical protein EI94DRAFT_1720975 [Lactarius quietus]|nr:hypothetical protein EI94DRAFT_1720975 [Lactarius quietus]
MASVRYLWCSQCFASDQAFFYHWDSEPHPSYLHSRWDRQRDIAQSRCVYSSLSKICAVGSPSEAQKAADLNVEYTSAQVGIRNDIVNYSGNCGGLSGMIGVFAMDEGICTPRILHSTFYG